MTHTPQHFACWFEIPVTDLDASKAFYAKVFDMELMAKYYLYKEVKEEIKSFMKGFKK